jgi:hypothetical protein
MSGRVEEAHLSRDAGAPLRANVINAERPPPGGHTAVGRGPSQRGRMSVRSHVMSAFSQAKDVWVR